MFKYLCLFSVTLLPYILLKTLNTEQQTYGQNYTLKKMLNWMQPSDVGGS